LTGKEFDFTLKQNQTIENLIQDIGSSNRDQDWINLALRNDLKEEDYTPEGGVVLKATFQNNAKIEILSVLDNIQGTNVYGKDIYRRFIFEDNDLLSLSPENTIHQAFDINIELRRGDNPEFANDGLQSSLIVGSNLNSILYPSEISTIIVPDKSLIINDLNLGNFE